MGIIGKAVGKGLGYVGDIAGNFLGGLIPFQQGGIVMPVKKVKRGRGKGTKAMKAKMAKLRAMRK
jgi:hypothetical protein